MIYSLIGMSSAGKTHWSFKLEKEQYVRMTCDDLIEEKLKPILARLGYQGISDVAKWMGFPYEPQYPQNSATYLSLENDVMRTILRDIQSGILTNKKVIIDTTGSVIYTDPDILHDLKRLTMVIYLDIPESKKQEIYHDFLKHPKPIIWGDAYQTRAGETELETVARCYSDLLSFRIEKYSLLADITIPYEIHRQKDFSAEDFISHITTS